VGISRAYVRIHHASDVVGGVVVGAVLGILGRRMARRLAP
ncbi:MAG: phosphatase PAP2 family protein, partial [Ilumatobacteraceae bacterium]|nr:phosphatase PAP2 family protein [Ilumatobacteraceae bacterium]